MFPQIFGKYVLERELAAGGMAVVYLATLRGAGGFEKRLVVKQIRSELASDAAFVSRFVDEAKVTVELSHPNIVPVYELGVEQGVYYIAMELAEGVTLAELLGACGPLSAEEGAYLGVEICRALDYAHRRASIVHRDVTPRNVLIDREGAVRVIDFGIAAPYGTGARHKVFGSPGHMPAEQVRGGRLTPATDVFAVGALLIEAWTGRAPFRRDTAAACEAALEQPPEPLSASVPALAPLDALMARAVAYDQNDRPESAEELARALRDFLRSADAGDIARRIGRRVETLQGEQRAELETTTAAMTPVTAAARARATSVTETFATGAEMHEWTRRFPSEPPRPSTRPSDRPTPTLPGAAESDPSRSAARPRVIGWPAVLLALIGLVATFWIARPRAVSAPPSRPAARSALVQAAEPRVRPVSVRGGPDGSGGRARDSVDRAADVSAPGPSAVEPSPQPKNRPAVGGSGEDRVAVGASSGPASAAPSADAPVAPSAALAGTLDLTSDLPASVQLSGVTIGATPVRGVKRSPGRYAVVFVTTNAMLEERVSTVIELGPGQILGVHAEFTRASPAISLRR